MTDFQSTSRGASCRSRRPLRICHLAYTFYEADSRVIRYAESLVEQGAEVDVIALRRPSQPRLGYSRGVRVFRVQRRVVTEKSPWTYLAKILWFFAQASALLAFLQLRKRYDIVHVHNVPDFLIVAALVPKLMGSRVILDIHDILPELYATKFGASSDSAVFRWLALVERLSCRLADHVIVANDLWREKLIQRSVPAVKCTTMLNYPDLRLFRPLAERAKRGDAKFIFLYPGSLNYHQGVDIAIKAFAIVKDRMPNAEFHIYGEGPARLELERATSQCGLHGRVKMMDLVSIDEISRVISSADVGVVPKRAEGFGNEAFSTKILEFMACGVPAIVSRTRIDDFYFDDGLVRFFTPGNEEDLAEKLVEAYGNHGDLEWARRAQKFAFHNSWHERAIGYERIIDSLTARRSCHAPTTD